MREDRDSVSSHFITFTYDSTRTDTDGHTVPLRSTAGYSTLSKRHLQLFFKRLRKKLGHQGRSIKYYAVGEYGSKGRRPHYHVLLFNGPQDTTIYNDAWSLGSIHVGDVREASVGYTLKYLQKSKWHPLHRNDDRLPEFSLMSKRLGISYLSDQMIAWHKADIVNRVYATIPGGKKISLPRYFKEKIYSLEERAMIRDHYEWQHFFHEKYEKYQGVTVENYREFQRQNQTKVEGIFNQSTFFIDSKNKL